MPTVQVLPVGGPDFEKTVVFAVAPRMGETVMLRIDGKRHQYKVADAHHFTLTDDAALNQGVAVGYAVDLIWEGRVGAGHPARERLLRLVTKDD